MRYGALANLIGVGVATLVGKLYISRGLAQEGMRQKGVCVMICVSFGAKVRRHTLERKSNTRDLGQLRD